MTQVSLRDAVRATPRRVWFLYAGTFVNRFGSFVLPFLILYLTEAGYSKATAGAALGAYGIGALAASMIGGFLADRAGRKQTIALSMFGSATAMLALSQARGLGSIVALTALAGAAAETYRPASAALLGDLIPPERRVAAFALYRLAINVGWSAGPAVAGLLAGRSFFLLFLVDAITSAVYGLIAVVALPRGVVSSRRDERSGEAIRSIASDRTFLLFLAATFFGGFIYFQGFTTLALHVKAAGMSAAVYGMLQSINGIVVVFLELPIASITQRRDPRTVLVVAMLLSGLGFALTGPSHTALALAGTVVVWTLGEIAGGAVSGAYVTGLAPPRLRGRYNGAWGMTFSIGFVVAPGIGAAVFSRDPSSLWALCGVLGVAAAVCVAAGRPRRVSSPVPDEAAPGAAIPAAEPATP